MKRIRPCEFCKQRRRKCERPLGSISCTRCSRLNLVCVYDMTAPTNMRYNTSSTRRSTAVKTIAAAPMVPDWDMTEEDGDEELQDLCGHVRALELELQQLQQKLNQQRQQSSALQPGATTTDIKVNSLPIPKEWNLTFVKGYLRLETGINTLGDLLQYRLFDATTSTPIPYLSPFNSSTPIRFSLQQEGMINKAVFILRKYGIFNESGRQISSDWNHRHQLPINSPTSPSSPLPSSHPLLNDNCCDSAPARLSPTVNYCPESIVDPLIRQYFACHNPTMPLIHEATFMTHYNKQPGMTDPTPSGTKFDSYYNTPSYSPLTSPYSSTSSTSSRSSSSTATNNGFISPHNPVTLAICCFMSVSYCSHISFTSHQKREYGEYFYVACREQVDDRFDDPSPHRQLEALISINFLYRFMLLTLRLNDARKLATLGFLISNGLSKQVAQRDTTLSNEEQELTTRHTILATMSFTAMEFIYVKRMDDILPKKIILTPLPGESDTTVSMLSLYKHLFDLILHNDIIVIVHQLRRVMIGEEGQVTLENMIRFEQTCLSWWRSLPEKWRYCEQPYDPSAKHAIEQCDYEQALMVHSNFLAMTLGVHSILLHPQSSSTQASDIIQRRAMMVALTCCELLMVVSDRLKVVSNYCAYSCDYALRICDCLQHLLEQSQKIDDKSNTAKIMKYMDRCLSDLGSVILSDHRVPSEMSLVSPFSSFSSTLLPSPGDDAKPLVYTKYPLPAHALLFDIVSSSAKKIGLGLP